MSYDLYFLAAEPPTQAAFTEHFAGRPWYEIEGAGVRYANEDTGVYFVFSMEPAESRAEGWASFNLNFGRPQFFAAEAAIELEAFVARFGSKVSDPQVGGSGEGEFSVEAFLQGWSRGNSMACTSLASMSLEASAERWVRPRAEMHRIWQWNFQRRMRQEDAGVHIFVPRIDFFQVEGPLVTGTVWGDGMPVILPVTEVVVVYRDRLAPRRWLRRQKGVAVAPWADVERELQGFPREAEPFPHHRLEYASPPRSIAAWVKELPAVDALGQVPMDQVLDAELFESKGSD